MASINGQTVVEVNGHWLTEGFRNGSWTGFFECYKCGDDFVDHADARSFKCEDVNGVEKFMAELATFGKEVN